MATGATTETAHVCACVHHDAFECAFKRDGLHVQSPAPRRCECVCHKREDENKGEFWESLPPCRTDL